MFVWILLAILLFFIIFVYNSIIKSLKSVQQSASGIDVYLQQRFDLIPNLVEVTKGYMNYEKEVLEKISALRTLYNQNNKDIETINELNKQYHNIMLLVENYPSLKADQQFLKLQKTLIKIESQLQAARRIYNNDVTNFNTKISTFPNNLVAGFFNFKEEKLFVLEGEDTVNIEF